jgi:hypothetical protein
MGKKPAFDDAKRARAIELAAQCLTMQDVADELGVGRRTLYEEMGRNRTFRTEFLRARDEGAEQRASSFSSRAYDTLIEMTEELGTEHEPQMMNALSGAMRVLLGGLGRADSRWSEKTKVDADVKHNGLVKATPETITKMGEIKEEFNGNGSNGHDKS